jgi:hypothetical protein
MDCPERERGWAENAACMVQVRWWKMLCSRCSPLLPVVDISVHVVGGLMAIDDDDDDDNGCDVFSQLRLVAPVFVTLFVRSISSAKTLSPRSSSFVIHLHFAVLSKSVPASSELFAEKED